MSRRRSAATQADPGARLAPMQHEAGHEPSTAATAFAPAHRAGPETVERAWRTLSELAFVREVVNSLPFVVAVLNRDRQLVFWNDALFKAIGAEDVGDVLGKRPGEAIQCVHATEGRGGCGTSEACRHCGALRAVLRCLVTDGPADEECRISTRVDGQGHSLDLKVTARPVKVEGETFVIVTVADISDAKRRRALERLFFHDVINLAGGLRGMVELMQQIKDPDRLHRLTKDLSAISDSLLDEIMAQRELSAVESGEYHPRPDDMLVGDLFHEVAHHLRHHEAARSHSIVVEPVAGDLLLRADHTLARRVLVNMLKNALEASPRGSDVRLTAEVGAPGFVRLSVHNAGHMPREVQLQMFQRSFSTKGADRGLGTYSMKLFTEQYLGGRLRFESTEDAGTVFTTELPASPFGRSAAAPPDLPGDAE